MRPAALAQHRAVGPEELESEGRFQHVYLSPHLDDAVLSCGGGIALHEAHGERVLVVTLCTAAPDDGQEISAFARAVQPSGTTATALIRLRQGEDERAMHSLGAQFHWAGELDAIYRMAACYQSFHALTGEIGVGDPLVERAHALARRVAPGAMLHAPLGVGRHVDHQIVHAAARAAARPVRFYEDIPYALTPGALDSRLAETGGHFQPMMVDISTALETWIGAVSIYESQVGPFGGELQRRMRVHASALGQGTASARDWVSS